MEVNSFEFIDHGGGQNDGPSPSHIADRELASLVNFYPYGQSLIRRNGVAQLTQTPAGIGITTLQLAVVPQPEPPPASPEQ